MANINHKTEHIDTEEWKGGDRDWGKEKGNKTLWKYCQTSNICELLKLE